MKRILFLSIVLLFSTISSKDIKNTDSKKLVRQQDTLENKLKNWLTTRGKELREEDPADDPFAENFKGLPVNNDTSKKEPEHARLKKPISVFVTFTITFRNVPLHHYFDPDTKYTQVVEYHDVLRFTYNPKSFFGKAMLKLYKEKLYHNLVAQSCTVDHAEQALTAEKIETNFHMSNQKYNIDVDKANKNLNLKTLFDFTQDKDHIDLEKILQKVQKGKRPKCPSKGSYTDLEKALQESCKK